MNSRLLTNPEPSAPRGATSQNPAEGSGRRAFQSILFNTEGPADSIRTAEPEFFRDLNIDQIVSGVTRGREEYNLATKSIFAHEIFRDLQNPSLLNTVRTFSQQMRTVRDHLAQAEKHSYKRQQQSAVLPRIAISPRSANWPGVSGVYL